MPELPEVETLVRRLREPLIGRTVEDVTIYWKRTIARPAPKEFARMVRGCTVQAIDRRAKYLVFTLRGVEASAGFRKRAAPPARASTPSQWPTLFLLIHLKMSGKLNVVDRSAPIEKHDRVVFDLDHGQQLRFNDVRKFGKMWAVIDPAEVAGAIGPEPLAADFDLPKFRALVQSRSGAIKPLLLNQTFLAGVGNIYADESLWRAKLIHSEQPTAYRMRRLPRFIDRSATCCAGRSRIRAPTPAMVLSREITRRACTGERASRAIAVMGRCTRSWSANGERTSARTVNLNDAAHPSERANKRGQHDV